VIDDSHPGIAGRPLPGPLPQGVESAKGSVTHLRVARHPLRDRVVP